MGFSVESRVVGSVVVLDLSGASSIMDGNVLEQTVRGLLREGKLLFVLNLKGLRHIDSFGLGQLVSTFMSVKDQKGAMKLVNPSPTVTNLLRYTRIDTVLQVVPSEEEAVQELERPQA